MFQSEPYRDEFQQHPQRYWPVADGQCIVSAFDEGVARMGTLQYVVEQTKKTINRSFMQ